MHPVPRLLQASRCQLALSLHATTDEVRDWIVPVNRRHDLQELKAVLLEFFALGKLPGVWAHDGVVPALLEPPAEQLLSLSVPCTHACAISL